MIYIFDETQTMTGVIDVSQTIEAKLTLEINKAGTLDVVLPPKSEFNEKMANAAYLAVPYPNDAQKLFFARLLTRKDEDDQVTYEASEMAYHELDTYGVIDDKRPTDKDAQFYLDTALEATQWRSGVVNVAGTTSVNFYKVTPLQAINSVVEVLGGELVFYVTLDGSKINGCYVDWVAQQGTDTSKTFAHGSNLLTVERQTDRTSVYTAIMPRGKGEEVSEGEGDSPDGYGRRIEIDGIEWSKANGDPLDKPFGDKILVDPEATKLYGQRDGQPRLLIQTYDKIEDRTELINAGYKTLMEYNHPQVQYSATVANVGDMQLGDTVVIMHSERSMTYKTRVFKITYDLQNNANTEAEFGDDLTKNDITSQVSSISSSTSTISEQTQWNISNGGHNNTSYGPNEPANPRQGDVWYKVLPNGNTEMYYWNGNTWVLGATTDQQWKENQAIAQGSHTTFYGPDEPTGAVKGDVWFKNDNNEPDGKAMYTYDGADWIKFEGSADASRLQIGTIDASKINVLNLSADNIASGTMSANFIKGGQIDASQVNVINLSASNITSGYLNAAQILVTGLTSNIDMRNGGIHFIPNTGDAWETIVDAKGLDISIKNISRTSLRDNEIVMYNNAAGYYRLGGLKSLLDTSVGTEAQHNAGIYLALDEWHTTAQGDQYYEYGGEEFFGGSEVGLAHSSGVDGNGFSYSALMKWSNDLAAGRISNTTKGFNFYDQINWHGNYFIVDGAANKFKFTWVSWSDWGNYHNIAMTNESASAGIAVNNDNLVLFGGGKRADATTGWNA